MGNAPGHDLAGQTLVLVAVRDSEGQASGRLVVASDALDAGAGEDVTVAFGSGARRVLAGGATDDRTCCATPP